MISEGHFNLTMSSFHSRTGSLVTLSNNNKTAQRNEPAQEFNNGVVVTEIPLVDNQLFEVRIDRKVNSWSGSIEIGVTRCDPNNLAFPASATGFREGTWIMSGSALLKDGHTIREEYGQDLDGLAEGDKVGVMRKSAGDLHFFVNGVDQGLAASNIPASVYGVVDMYGKCAQVTLCADGCREEVIANEITNEAIAEATFTHSNERLTFHEKCGSLVKLSNNRRTAERRRPMDEFNNGVVMTNRPVKDDELFEIRIDRMVDKWSGSIEVGITTHNPNTLEFPATMTNMRSGTGTIMMSGCGILTNGKGTRREYGEFNLDELREGDRIGLIRKSNGNLHYYINGIDQGIAATRTPTLVWGVVDLYGMAVKVTIVDGGDYPERGRLESQANSLFRQFRSLLDNQNNEEVEECEPLLFHSRCGSQCAIIDGGKTAHRPNAMEYFNHAVAFTNRMLKPGEGFEVRVDKMVDKWAGSLEIGVTTHSAEDLDNPSTMTNVRSGTWMMTGSGIMHNGTTTVDEYGYNLDRLNTGDRISVKRLDDGILHFYVNGVDQGVAASNVPSQVYGVVDLYGQAAQVSIIDNTEQRSIVATPTALNPVGSDHTELRFHQLHGRNAAVLNNGRSSQRPNARGEFNDAIVISNRPLRDNEMFEIVIEKMVDRWSGSIEAGVTLIKPEAIDFPNTMTDIDYDTWMLSGSAIMQDGSTIRNGYGCDLDILTVGSRIGMMRTSEGCLHFFVDGQDLGVACSDIPPGVYAVIDLYGQCAQVSITSGSGVTHGENQVIGEDIEDLSLLKGFGSEVSHRFSQCCGKNMSLRNNGGTACRSRSFDNGVVFSADPLKTNEIFEVKIDQLAKQWSGSFIIGLTTMAVSDNTSISSIPTTARDLGSKSKVTWIVSGSEVKKNGVTIKENYVASLDRLQVGNRVGVKRCSDASMHIYVNGDDMGVAATNIPRNVFVVMDLYGVVECVTIVSSRVREVSNMSHPPSISSDSTDSLEQEHDQDTAESSNVEFNKNRGKNILLTNNDLTATRSSSYNQAIVVSHKPLQRQKLFQVKIDRLDPRWTSSLMIGVMGVSPDKYSFPVSATSIKKACWVVKSDSVFQSSIKVKQGYGPNLDSLQVGHHVGILIDGDNSLHLYVNGIDQGVAAKDLPVTCYALADLYGQCEQVTIVTENVGSLERPPADTTEKATMEDGIKEMKMTSSNHPQVELPLVKNCEYMNMCSRFKSLVGLPDAYFLEDQIRCYCDTCHKVRSDEPYSRRGSPPKDFALPFGWCKFPLKTHVRSNAHHVEENWHQAFHGTRVEVLRRILDTGDLQIPSDMCTYMLSPRPGHDKPADGSDSSQVFFSPTIKYVGLAYCPRYEYKDPKSKKTQFARVAFHVCVKPSSYKVGPQTVGAREPIDVRFNNQELEWSTKEKGATVLVGLLVKIEQ